MPVGPGTRLGPYEVIAALGAGGMGEVYRARDTRLERTVAIKVLPAHVSGDPVLRDRFEREARTVAALNHPNICTLFDVGRDNGTDFLVMELLEGQTLAQRLTEGPLPYPQALTIAIQIAGALDKAHRAGIVHRDLKPANIMLTKSGAKLLDFGLAKVTPAAIAASGLSMAPTGLSPVTIQGTILGTLQYMAPEQIEGQEADPRTDIFAFGCVLYEMVSGRKAFEGKSHASLIGAILKDEPPALSTLQPAASPALMHVVETCLAKDPDRRWQNAADLATQLAWIAGRPSTEIHRARTEVESRTIARRAVPWLATALLAGAVAAAATWWFTSRQHVAPGGAITRFVAATPGDVAPRGGGVGRHLLALSPQGTHLVYWTNNALYVRALDEIGEGHAIPGTEGAREPFFSADGQWVGFFQGELKRVSIRGGAVMRLAAVTANPYGVSWTDDEVLYGLGRDGIWRVTATGGAPTRVIAVKDGESAHGPQRLPDGAILYTLLPRGAESWDDADIVVETSTGSRTVVVHGGRDARHVATGHLVYGVNGVLYAVAFDASSHAVRGDPAPVAERVMDADVRTGAMHYSVSSDGTLAYVVGPSGQRSTLVHLNREGRQSSLPQEPREYTWPRISPDGTRVAVEVGRGDARAIYIYDLERYALTRLTPQQLRGARFPLWTRDGQRIVFFSDSGGSGLFSIAADGTGTPTRLTTSTAEQYPYGWSADNRTLVFEQVNPRGIYLLATAGAEQAPMPLLRGGQIEPAVSPDGRWLAYASFAENERTRFDVYVQPFPDVNRGRWLIATDAYAPIWSRDGKELYFIAPGRAMAVSITTAPAFSAGTPRALFELGPYYQSAEGLFTRQWDIDPDGSRFIALRPGDTGVSDAAANQPQVVVVRNWFEELKRLVPATR